MYNSSTGPNRDDDADLTMIDQTLLYGENDGPTSSLVVRRMQQANRSAKKTTNFDDRSDYVYVEHDRLETAKEIERILNFYRQDLKQESNTQLDCNQYLITRLVDFLRPTFSSDETKMKDLDTLYEEISDLEVIRFIEQKEKIEQLTNEVVHLKKLIISSPNDGNQRENQMAKVYQLNSMVNYDQWIEMEEESKKLHHLIETQRNKINELIKLITPEDEPATASNPNRETRPSTDRPTGTVDKNAARPTAPALCRLPSSNGVENCPICKYKFPSTTTEFEIDDHMESCVAASTRLPPESERCQCPYCELQFAQDDEVYMNHLSECLNGRPADF